VIGLGDVPALPGAKVPPEFTVTVPPIVPMPFSVAPLFTSTLPVFEPLMTSVPPSTLVSPM
jgi:hypothetical protein